MTAPPTGPTVDRRTYIGGSQVAAVVGLNPWMSQLDVWAEVTGRSTEPVTIPMELGLAFERPLLEVYARRNNRRIEFPGTLIDPDASHRGATPDGIEDGLLDVQCKLVGRTVSHWGDPLLGAESIPDYVGLQATWEMRAIRVTRDIPCPAARVLMLHGTELRVYTMPWDEELAGVLVEHVDRFWRDHIVADRMPRVAASDEDVLARLYPVDREPFADAPAEVEELAREHAEIGARIAELKSEKDRVANELRLACGEAKGFKGPFGWVKCATERGRVAWKELAVSMGASDEQIEQHRSEDRRVLRVRVKDAA